ncbi:MAG: hypothetical protein ABFC96_11645 [Thermoguttaceae bacterium]
MNTSSFGLIRRSIIGCCLSMIAAGPLLASPQSQDLKNRRNPPSIDRRTPTVRDDRRQPDRQVRQPGISRRSALLAQGGPSGAGKRDNQPTPPSPPPQNVRRETPQTPPPNSRRDNPPSPPPQRIQRESPPSPPPTTRRENPPQTIKRDQPQPPKSVKPEPTPKQYQPSTPGAGFRRDENAPTKDQGKGPNGVKNRDQNPPKRDNRVGVGKDQSPPPDRSRIDDVRNRLNGRDRDRVKPTVPGKTPPPNVKPPQSIKPPREVQPPRDVRSRDIKQPRFDERLKTGEVNRIVVGPNAKQLRLADQYKLWRQGDVARRLQLEKHGPPPKLYHGVVSPIYHEHGFKYYYYGPSWFAGVHWYPNWTPWVKWSWYYRPPVRWDPRPVWCRPIFYSPSPVWVYWATPVWTPLPVVASGTWVDLSPVAVAPGLADLQLVAVRFVDPGHPEEKLGPRYRVWFRNNSAAPVTQPFNVMLFASNDQRLAPNLPQAGVRVTAVEAGDTQSVDIRLPVEVYTMNRDAQGHPAPFSTLHVLVDANREVAETTMANNGARLSPPDILPIDPAAFEIDPVAAQPGSEVLLAGEGFGPQPGRALVVVNGQETDAEILGWYDLGVRLTLPRVAVAAPTQADVIIIRGDGAAANPLKVTINP